MLENNIHPKDAVTIVLIEDEQPARELMESMINEIEPDWQIQARPGSVEAAVEWFQNNPHPDLVFVDIQLSDGLSFEIFETIDYQGMMIFTTAYDEYALQAFRVNSIDYLLKPIRMRELKRAIEKYCSWADRGNGSLSKVADLSSLLQRFANKEPVYRTRFLISRGENYTIVQADEIAYFNTAGHDAIIVTDNGTKQVVDYTLEELEQQLDPDKFFRISRKMIVRIDAIHKIHRLFNGRLSLVLEPHYEEEAIVSRQRVNDFKIWIDK